MSGVSAIDTGATTELPTITSEETKETSEPIVTPQQEAKPGESEARMRAEEALLRETSSNLKNLGRKKKVDAEVTALIKNQKPLESLMPTLMKVFELDINLLQEQLDDCKNAGIDLKELAQEIRIRMDKKNETLPFEGKHKELKNEVFKTYVEFLKTLGFHVTAVMKLLSPFSNQPTTPSPYINPFIQVYEFEEKNGFPTLSTALLSTEAEVHLVILSLGLRREHPALRLFYNGALFTGTLKLLNYLEEKKETELLNKVFKSHVLGIFFQSISIGKFWNHQVKTDPLIHFLPYVAKYGSLDQIEDYFNERFKKLEPPEKALKWMELYNNAGELLLSIDQEKSNFYLQKAEVIKYALNGELEDYFHEHSKETDPAEKASKWVELHQTAAEFLRPIDKEKSEAYLEKAEVIKHALIDQLEDYFHGHFNETNSLDTASKWVDLLCTAAKLLLSVDQEKAKAYLEKAEKEVENKIYTTPFTWNRSGWNAARETALKRIAEIKALVNQEVS